MFVLGMKMFCSKRRRAIATIIPRGAETFFSCTRFVLSWVAGFGSTEIQVPEAVAARDMLQRLVCQAALERGLFPTQSQPFSNFRSQEVKMHYVEIFRTVWEMPFCTLLHCFPTELGSRHVSPHL